MQVVLAALLLAATQLLVGRGRTLHGGAYAYVRSFAGGVSLAYVFLDLLPELSERHCALEAGKVGPPYGTFLLALVGLVAVFALDLWARGERRHPDRESSSKAVFATHLVFYFFYYGLVGYLITDEELRAHGQLAVYTAAMVLHFAVVDQGLRRQLRASYDRSGKWILAGAVLVGTVLGMSVAVPERITSGLLALLGGGIILNAIKEELPDENHATRLAGFLVGLTGYGALLLTMAR